MLEFKNITKKYGKNVVLDNVSFNIPKGHVCGLFGLNGAGKSTLMKILTSLILPTSGQIYYENALYNKLDSKIKVGYMIEAPYFYNDLSGFNNLKLLASLYDNISVNRINEVLNIVGLNEVANRPFKEYSLGMKQRLYFAYAIIDNPEILVLDEPFNGIDPITCKLFKDLIVSLAIKGTTVMVSSHVISDVKEIANKVVIIDHGHIVYDDIVHQNDNLEEIFIEKVSNGGQVQ